MAAAPPVPTADRTAHPFHTYEMIHAIPATFRETLRRTAEPAVTEAARLADRSSLAFTGSGTAFYSAMLAQRFAAATPSDRIRSAAITAFELSRYPLHIDRTWAVLGISHSGITKITVDALRDAKTQGARTVGVTHFTDRPIAAVSDSVFLAGDSPDLSRCHTKCYVAGALAAAQLALEWRVSAGREARSTVEPIEAALDHLPPLLDQVVRSTEKPAEELATAHLARRSVLFLGGGPGLSTAVEAALKVRETSFLPAVGMEIEDFLHGSWQSLDRDSLVFVVAPGGRSHARAVDLVKASRAVGAYVVAVTSEGDREIPELANTSFVLPRVDELLSPFLNIIPLYFYGYYSSVRRGHNPDLLRYLDPTYWNARQVVFPPGTH